MKTVRTAAPAPRQTPVLTPPFPGLIQRSPRVPDGSGGGSRFRFIRRPRTRTGAANDRGHTSSPYFCPVEPVRRSASPDVARPWNRRSGPAGTIGEHRCTVRGRKDPVRTSQDPSRSLPECRQSPGPRERDNVGQPRRFRSNPSRPRLLPTVSGCPCVQVRRVVRKHPPDTACGTTSYQGARVGDGERPLSAAALSFQG